MYKTKLQELCDVKKWAYPKYSAIKVGVDHDPRFTASVFINGAFFDSPSPCKSLKEAQQKAAEVALMHFISLSGDGLKTNDTSKSILPAEVGEVAKKRLEKISKSVAILRERASEVAELDMNSLSLNEYSQESRPKKAQGGNSKSKKNEKIDPAEMGGSSSIKGKEKLMDDKENAPAEETVHLKKQKDREMEISLLGKRFGVYSYVPDIANLPKGLTVMQVCEGKWIIMSLEFPNEKPT